MERTLVWTVTEAAKELKIGRDAMYALVRRPDFPKVYIGKQIRIPKKDLEGWIRDHVQSEQRSGATD